MKSNKDETIRVDCRKCKNVGNDCCKIYGSNAGIAVRACASDCFRNYKVNK